MLRSNRMMFENTANDKEASLIRDFAYDVCEELGDDWQVVDSSIGDPVAILHIPTNTTYHLDADATSRLNDRGYLKVVFAEQPNSIGSTYISGSCYTFDIDHAIKLLKFNAKRMEKWLEKHPYESTRRKNLARRRRYF